MEWTHQEVIWHEVKNNDLIKICGESSPYRHALSCKMQIIDSILKNLYFISI